MAKSDYDFASYHWQFRSNLLVDGVTDSSAHYHFLW